MTIGDWVSVVGLLIVIGQIYRTGRIAEATKVAVDEATKRVGLYNMLLIVPELSRLEKEIEDAVRDKEPSALRRLLKEWRELATDMRGALSNEDVASREIDQALANSVALAMLAKRAMMSDEADLFQTTKKVRAAIENVCVEARMLAAQVRSTASPFGILGSEADGQERGTAGTSRVRAGQRKGVARG